jgi:hypothetical protein
MGPMVQQGIHMKSKVLTETYIYQATCSTDPFGIVL